jgi:hypothetical protein
MKRILIAVLASMISFFIQDIVAHAGTLLVLESPTITVDGDGYSGHNWGNMTTAIDTATANNVDVVTNFSNLVQMLNYDSLRIDRRSAGYPLSDLLTATEINNILIFIQTGRRVVMIGE